VSETFDRLVKRSKLPRLTVHGLRHTWATLALGASIHPKVVQERFGHSSVAFTLDRSSHAIPAMQDDAAAKVAALVMGDA
jgi:integrase